MYDMYAGATSALHLPRCVKGFLLACWLALQDDVWEVQYGGYQGGLEEELVQFLMISEAWIHD